MDNSIMQFVASKLQDKEERLRLARKLLDEESSLFERAAFLNKNDGSVFSIKDLIEKEGYDKALEMVLKVLESFADGNNESICQSIDADRVNEALVRVERGEGTEDDIALAKMFSAGNLKETLAEKNSESMMHMILEHSLEMIRFAMEEKHYTPTFSDFTTIMEMLLSESLQIDPNSVLHQFKDSSNASTVINIGKEVAADMQAACQSTIWKDKDIKPEYIIMGLLAWLNEIAANNLSFVLSPARDIVNHMGIGDDEDESENHSEVEQQEQAASIPGVTQPICHGSNSGKVVSFADNRAMKNLLKDD